MNIVFDAKGFQEEVAAITMRFAERLPAIIQATTLDSFAKIRNRIQETGKDAKGGSLKPYSDNKLPAFFFEEKATNASGKYAVEQAEEEGTGLSYKEFKSANNGPESVAVRNLTLTGDMWRNTGIVSTEQTDKGLICTVAGETKNAQEKINWNAEIIGDFLALSEQEELEVTENLQEEIDAFFEQQ